MRAAASQLRKTRSELERELKARDRTRLRELREGIRKAKKSRQLKLRQVSQQCRAARRHNIERAKRARVRLRESIQRTYQRAKTLCGVSRGEAKGSTLRDIEKAVAALTEEQRTQSQLAAWTRPTSCRVVKGQKRERREESDCEVAANLDDPGLRVVWERVKARIKAGPRRTRTEAFLEWAQEHPSDVYAIQDADAARALDALEREEKALGRALKQTHRYKKRSPEELRDLLAGVPF